MDDGSSTQPGTRIMDRQHSSGCPGALGVRFVRPPSSEVKPVHSKNAPKVNTFDEKLGALLHKFDTCGLFVVSFGCLNKILRGPGTTFSRSCHSCAALLGFEVDEEVSGVLCRSCRRGKNMESDGKSMENP